METFCGSSFWDQELTWNTQNPDFTTCFQKTALVWIPCGFLWLLAPVEFYLQLRNKEKRLPWTGLTLFKIFLSLCLVGFSLADMIHDLLLYADDLLVFPADYYASFIKTMTYILVTVMVYAGRMRGARTSGIQFIFWLLTSLCEIIIFRSVLLRLFSNDVPYSQLEDRYTFVVVSCTFPIVIGQFFLSIFAEQRLSRKKGIKRDCPEEASSFLSQLTFWWFNSLVTLGYKQPLTLDDMWDLSKKNSSDDIVQRFDKHWKPNFAQENRPERSVAKVVSNGAGAVPSSERKTSGIFLPMIRTFSGELLLSGLFKLVGSIITFGNPVLLDLLINFISGNEPYWRGFLYAALVFVISSIESIFNSQYEYFVYRIGMKSRSCLTSALFRKTLVLSSTARKDYTVGEIVNLMAVDSQRVMEQIHLFHLLWSAPLQIAIALYMLWQQIGISTLAGLGVMILLIPLNGWITSQLKKLQVHLMKEKDKRTKLMSELLSGIKVLKLYAWEESFQEQVMKIRRREIGYLRSGAYYSSFITFIFASLPFLVSIASFTTYILISSENILDANKAFVSLALFNILRIPLAFLPMMIMFTAMFIVSLKRLNKFLQSDELDPKATEHNHIRDTPVLIEKGSFGWSQDNGSTLKDIDLRVKEGSLVAIVGQVGAGKSSLLSALLGDMVKHSGKVNITGKVAYVPQQAWIQNASLRKNVLFLKEMEKTKYDKTLDSCCLTPDLEVLPGGDMTEIGEKGINLSGGQKQRVSLARAVYSDADIYLLDDPLSAVDSHVSKDIFDHVIGNTGLLKKKTRILVTHRVTVLPHVDTIFVLKDGVVTESGSYTELLMQKGAFAEFLVQYLTGQGVEEVDGIHTDDLHVIEHIAATVGSVELQRQLSRLSGAESDDQKSDYEGRKMSRQVSQSSIPPGSLLTRRRLSSVSSAQLLKTQKSLVEKPKSKTRLIDAEVAQVGSVKWSVYLSYFKASGQLATLVVLITYFASYSFNVGSNIWLSAWSNDALDPIRARDPAVRDLRLGVYGALGTGETVFVMLGTLFLSLTCLRASRILHDEALVHILMAPMSFFDTTPMGRILNRFSKDVDTIDMTIRFNIRMLLLSVFRTLSSIVVVSLQSAFILVAAIPLAVLYYVVQMYYIATSRQLKRLESVSKSPIYTHFSETINGSTSIRAYGAAQAFVTESNVRVDNNHTSYFSLIASNRWLAIRLEFLGYCISFLAALFAVLAKDSLSPGLAGLAISYALTFTGTLNMLVRATCDMETNIVSVERCLEYTRTPTEAPRLVEQTKPEDDWPGEGRIEFKNYATRYREGLDLVLRGISCTIQPKEKVGIVGRTGAGKSSLTLSIFRLIESTRGRILIDGVDISTLGLYTLRAKLTIIPQDPVLFAGTLRLNLDPFEEHADGEIWEVLEHAHLKTFVSTLEKGLEHEVAEGGDNLSVGQRQLLCLARALLRKTKILVMDEATAAVDMETDELIQATIRSEFADCTVLTIAHRLNTIVDYDKVIVLEKGEIVEFDDPSKLMKDSTSSFYAMAKDANLV